MERDTDAYLAMLPAERLACAGHDEWRLGAYIAPQGGGRGCYPMYVTDLFWLDGSCNILFPQPVERQYDADEALQAFVHPDLGDCPGYPQPPCPFDDFKGSWVEMIGHLDDPAAVTCVAVPSSWAPSPPPPPPDADLVVHECRLRLVVTEILPSP